MSEEINISQLLENILISCYKYIARNKFILIIFSLLGILLGSLFYFTNKNVYVSKMIATPNVYEPHNISKKQIEKYIGEKLTITRYDAINVANSLQQFVSKKEKLSKLLSISLDDAKKIKQIDSDSIENTVYYFITIKYENGVDLSNLENGIIKYINESSYIKSRMKIAKEKNRLTASKIEKEILKLEIFQQKILQTNDIKSKLGEVIVIDSYTNFFHEDILAFDVLKQTCINNEKTATAVELSQSLTFSKQQKFPLFIILAITLILSLIVGFFVGVTADIRKKVKSKKYKNRTWKRVAL